MSSEETRKLPLHAKHVSMGARFAPFAGFEMPVRFGSIVEEHQAVRTNVGLFDVSHMGEIEFTGPRALEVLDNIATNDISQLNVCQALYTVMCHDDGGIVDDLLIYRLASDHYLACVNAANRQKDLQHMTAVAGGRCDVVDRSDDYVQLAVQGPKAIELMAAVAGPGISGLASFESTVVAIGGAEVLISRTGYTGEDGVELYYPTADAEAVFDLITAAGQEYGLQPIGLAARDTLRLEARLMLYGNDINDGTTPYEAGLSWLVKLNKGSFLGRGALEAQKKAGVTRRLRGLILQGRGVLRPHYPVFSGDVKVGETTSGGPSPTLGRSIALAYIEVDHANAEFLDVEVRGKRLACDVTRKPFYKRSGG